MNRRKKWNKNIIINKYNGYKRLGIMYKRFYNGYNYETRYATVVY